MRRPSRQPAVKERIEVTGSSIRRVEGEGALPVQVMTRADIEKSGSQTVMDLIDRLSAAQSIGNFNNTLGEGTTLVGFNGVSLRGLGTQRSLVLIDGKRTAPYALSNTSSPSAAGVDLNSIPLSAIERVEILKDGASALYGSDAIGGVINFILRKDFRGAEASFTMLDSDHGGGGSRRYNAIVGAGDLAKDHYNVFITADYLDQFNLRAADRQISHSAYLPQFGARSHVGQLAACQYQPVFGRFRARRDRCSVQWHAQPDQPGLPAAVLVPDGGLSVAVPVRLRGHDRRDSAEPADERVGQGRLSAHARPPGVPRGFVLPRRLPATHFANAGRLELHYQPTIMLPSNPFYPSAYVASLGGDPRSRSKVSYRGVETGPRSDEAKTDAYRAVAGLQGLIGGWDYQVAARYTENQQKDNYVGGYLSETTFLPLLATVDQSVRLQYAGASSRR